MNKTNTNLTFMGNPLKVSGKALTEGSKIPSFKLTGNDMMDLTESFIAGKTAIILVVPSLDTPVCSIEVKRFNNDAGSLPNTVVLTVSMDLPFAQKRWCGAEGAKNVTTASDHKYRNFGESFGAFLPDVALLARSVFVVDSTGTLRHVEYVTELSAEPEYATALNAARNCES